MQEPQCVEWTTDVLTLSLCLSASVLAVIKSDTDMDAQSTVDAVETDDSGLTPSTIPGGCDDSQNGVSVGNMPEPKANHEWYVFRASYGREEKAETIFKGFDIVTYIPRHTIYIRIKNRVKSVTKNLLPNFVFAYLTKEEAELYTKGYRSDGDMFQSKSVDDKKNITELTHIISYYYDHFNKGQDGRNPPLTIPFGAMTQFYIATRTEKDVMPVNEREYKIGEEVVVTSGEFKGLRGKVIRELKSKGKLQIQFVTGEAPATSNGKAKRRLLFKLPCLGDFCSASIPVEYFIQADSVKC